MKNITVSSVLLAASAVSAMAANVFQSTDITTDTTWNSTDTYILERPIFVKNGATLTINAGTIVRGQPRSAAVQTGSTVGTPGALVVTQSGKLVCKGTSTAPVIFTTAAVDVDGDMVADGTYPTLTRYTGTEPLLDDDPLNAPLAPLNGNGDANVTLWGGMVICGNAPTNLANAEGLGFGKGIVEGLTVPGFPDADATFGGEIATDNSGSIEYISIRHAGDEIGDGNELNGLTLAGVGSGTKIDHVEIYCNFDDGIEWFGGTVNSKHLIVTFAGDDSFDMDQGFTGFNQFGFVVMPFFFENDGGKFGSKSGDKAGEWDGDDSVKEVGSTGAIAPDNVAIRSSLEGSDYSTFGAPFSSASFYNLTVLGTEPERTSREFAPTVARGGAKGIDMRHGFAGRLFSSVIVNSDKALIVEVGAGATLEADQTTALDPLDPYYGMGSIISDATTNATNGYIVVGSTTFAAVDNADFGTYELAALANGDAVASHPNRINNDSAAPYTGSALATTIVVNPDQSFNPQGDSNGKLVSSLKASPINPRSKPGPGNLNTNSVPTGGESVTYRGAFNNSSSVDLWTDGWTVLGRAGLLD